MDFPMQPRYDPERAVYRDCRFCQGKGCIACPGEADKDYKKAFPGGPQPILTIHLNDLGQMKKLRSALGPKAMMAAKREGQRQAEELIKNLQPWVSADRVRDLGTGIAGEIVHKNILKLAKKLKKKPKKSVQKRKAASAKKKKAAAAGKKAK